MQNVRFLANFLTEAGIIIKRSKVNCCARLLQNYFLLSNAFPDWRTFSTWRLELVQKHKGKLPGRSRQPELLVCCHSQRWEQKHLCLGEQWRISIKILWWKLMTTRTFRTPFEYRSQAKSVSFSGISFVDLRQASEICLLRHGWKFSGRF